MADSPNETLLETMCTPEFWRCYTFDDEDGFDLTGESERIAELIGDDVRLGLPAFSPWLLRLRLYFDVCLFELRLETLNDDEIDECEDDEYAALGDDYETYLFSELGHWDQARWSPWCLRWEELGAVVSRMATRPDRQQIPPELAMLLLARFVGHGVGDEERLAAGRRLVAAMFTRLGVFEGAEAERMAARLLLAAPDDDYAWRRDPERGWVFGGAYPCYSNRNAEHGSFPFARWAEFRTLLGVTG
ncbi:hypothetical protein EV385_3932 [Krasilnikovia cinnamomea]|uniref:Uncharacterized protein n=1 Tax=Krasilnikovia cinnamomea TaxID=349313 RepID=A0A4Q7ZN48_9ACTN|nr:hypothetical protein [Krasilnikovia cinnamomea]RZU52091.1 hypothetical protein EV385_3932 [Krasilnikovia cinnamomea]